MQDFEDICTCRLTIVAYSLNLGIATLKTSVQPTFVLTLDSKALPRMFKKDWFIKYDSTKTSHV